MANQEWLDKLKAEPGVPGVTLTLITDIERLQAEVQRLKDECDRLEAERLDACNLRNFAYIERDNLRALLESVADFLATPWFHDWPTAQAKLSEIQSAIANLKEG